MKSRGIRSLRVLTLLAMCYSLAATAHAAPFPTTTLVSISAFCADLYLCNFDVGSDLRTYFGAEETAIAIFDPVVPGWSFNFSSSAPLSWSFQLGQDTGTYEAVFGEGGFFGMTGNLMTFTGMMTRGSSSEFCNSGGCEISVDAFFFGQWSNGMYASGEAGLIGFLTSSAYVTASLNTAVVPEPNSLALFSSGIIGLAGLVRRSLSCRSR